MDGEHGVGVHHDDGYNNEFTTAAYDDDGIIGEGVDNDEDNVDFDDPKIASLPRILLMGPRRSGKSSIQRVVFYKMSPHETLFRLEATQQLERSVINHTPLCQFTVWDFPGDYYGDNGGISSSTASASTATTSSPNADDHHNNNNETTMATTQQPSQQEGDPAAASSATDEKNTNNTTTNEDHLFLGSTSVVFVMDAQDEPYDHVLQLFTSAVTRAIKVNPSITIEVFINKVDGELFLSDESKYDCRRDIMQQVGDELAEAGLSPENVHIRYHLTSIYDHSIYEALSRVVQRLIPQLPTLENLLNVLVSTCSMEKAYLFDVASKLYISTDSSQVDMQSVELCSDMIDVVLDVSGIYGLGLPNSKPKTNGNHNTNSGSSNNYNKVSSNDMTSIIGDNNDTTEGTASLSTDEHRNLVSAEGEATAVTGATSTSGQQQQLAEATTDELVGTLISQVGGEDDEDDNIDTGDSAYDNESSSVIRLSNGMVLYLKEVDTMLALVCLTRSENFRKKSLINYNIGCLKKALRSLVKPTSD